MEGTLISILYMTRRDNNHGLFLLCFFTKQSFITCYFTFALYIRECSFVPDTREVLHFLGSYVTILKYFFYFTILYSNIIFYPFILNYFFLS